MPIPVQFLEQFSRHPPDDDRVCQSCGYPLRGLPAGNPCPECGASDQPDSDGQPAPSPPRKVKPPTCRGCGYLLKGLPSSGRCPECGGPYRPADSFKRIAVLIPDPVLESVSWRAGLTIMAMASAGALFMQLVVLFARVTPREYTMLMAGISAAWIVGLHVWVPRSIDGDLRFIRTGRRLTLVSQWLWPAGFTLMCLQLSNLARGHDQAFQIIASCCFVIAGLGTVGAVSLMVMAAKDLYMRDAARRLLFTAFFFLPYSIGIWIAPYPAFVTVGIPLSPYGGLLAFIYLVLLSPWWFMFITVLVTSLQMAQRGRWAIHVKYLEATRADRVAAKRDRMNASVGVKEVGPRAEVPDRGPAWDASGDIPLEGPPKEN